MAHTSRPERMRNLPDRNIQARHKDLGMQTFSHFGRRGGLEEQRERFREVVTRLLDGVALASDVKLRAERDVAVAFTLDDCGKLLGPFHCRIPPPKEHT